MSIMDFHFRPESSCKNVGTSVKKVLLLSFIQCMSKANFQNICPKQVQDWPKVMLSCDWNKIISETTVKCSSSLQFAYEIYEGQKGLSKTLQSFLSRQRQWSGRVLAWSPLCGGPRMIPKFNHATQGRHTQATPHSLLYVYISHPGSWFRASIFFSSFVNVHFSTWTKLIKISCHVAPKFM